MRPAQDQWAGAPQLEQRTLSSQNPKNPSKGITNVAKAPALSAGLALAGQLRCYSDPISTQHCKPRGPKRKVREITHHTRENQMTPQDAQAFLDENFAPWVRALNLTFTDIENGKATATMPITDQTTRMGDILSGQALAAMADTIMVFACFAHYNEVKPVATTNLDTQFLRPGVGTHIRCEAEVVRAGKALIFTKATMIAVPSEKTVATASATFYVP